MESGNLIQVAPLTEDASALLAKLSHPAWYLPVLDTFGKARQREWLAVRVLLKEMLGEEKQVFYTPSGSPYLADHSLPISFSHTKGFVAVAVGSQTTQRIAIDIETISTRVQRVRKKFMSEEEECHLDLSQENIHLLLHWSAKESLYKLLDNDCISFKRDLIIQPFVPVPNCWDSFSAIVRESSGNDRIITLHYRVEEEYVLTWCSI